LLNNEHKHLGPNQNSTKLLKQNALHIYFQFLKMNFPHEHSDPPHDKLILGAQSVRNVGDEKHIIISVIPTNIITTATTITTSTVSTMTTHMPAATTSTTTTAGERTGKALCRRWRRPVLQVCGLFPFDREKHQPARTVTSDERVATVSVFLTVRFSHARCCSGRSSIWREHAATVALSKVSLP